MEYNIKLHNDKKLLSQLIIATAQKYNIQPAYIEKDYWVTYILQRLAKSQYVDSTVFKGGTSLSKGYKLISRFSEDVDLALCHTEEQSGNNIKNLIRSIEKEITSELREVTRTGVTSKGSRFRKSVFEYDSVYGSKEAIGTVIVETNSFVDPYPYEKLTIESFIATFLKEAGQEAIIEEYDLHPFKVNVLDKRQTLIEKLVSLIRFSHIGISGISSKIRHFYDLHYLLQDSECREYIESPKFKTDFETILAHDKETFVDPLGWQDVAIKDIPLFNNTETIWIELAPIYRNELSELAFEPIPEDSKILKSITIIVNHINKID